MRKSIGPFIFLVALSMNIGTAPAASPLGLGSQKNNDKPIEINADSLEVFQEEHRAVFAGRVVAVQGDMRLKADKMVVFYRAREEEKNNGKTKAGSGQQQDAIQKIEVEGNVFLATAEETASGLSGVYDVENHMVKLKDQVVLTKGKNILKGDKLVYNLQTGQSSVTSGGVEAAGDKGKKGRVRALFVPDKKP